MEVTMKKLFVLLVLAALTLALAAEMFPEADLLLPAMRGDAEAQLRLGRAYIRYGLDYHEYVYEDYTVWDSCSVCVDTMAVASYPLYSQEGQQPVELPPHEEDLWNGSEWLASASELGNVYALNDYACCLMMGWGTMIEARKAFRLFKQAAEAGVPAAQYNLGWCYKYGLGVIKDPVEAYHWLLVASANGVRQAYGEQDYNNYCDASPLVEPKLVPEVTTRAKRTLDSLPVLPHDPDSLLLSL
jgi:TPR repeat protein